MAGSKPRLLDLFCGAGGAAMGYHRAGFDVLGIDINPQPHYPFPFVQADAMTYPLAGFDVIHASPPCQAYSRTRTIHKEIERADLLPATRERLQESGIPWIIENVPGAPIRADYTLCGQMFGLALYRHRLFELSNPPLLKALPDHPKHTIPGSRAGYWKPGTIISVAGHLGPVSVARKAMGIDWTTRDELNQAIPPAYTEYIGKQVLCQI